MKRLMENTVFCGLVMACRLAGSPTLRSPLSTKPTTDGVVRLPSLFAITTGSLPSNTATHEFVVPKSIPIIFPMICIVFIVYNLFYCICQLSSFVDFVAKRVPKERNIINNDGLAVQIDTHSDFILYLCPEFYRIILIINPL